MNGFVSALSLFLSAGAAVAEPQVVLPGGVLGPRAAVAQPHVNENLASGPLTPAVGDLVQTPRGYASFSLEGFSEDLDQDGFVDPIAPVVNAPVPVAPIAAPVAAPVAARVALPQTPAVLPQVGVQAVPQQVAFPAGPAPAVAVAGPAVAGPAVVRNAAVAVDPAFATLPVQQQFAQFNALPFPQVNPAFYQGLAQTLPAQIEVAAVPAPAPIAVPAPAPIAVPAPIPAPVVAPVPVPAPVAVPAPVVVQPAPVVVEHAPVAVVEHVEHKPVHKPYKPYGYAARYGYGKGYGHHARSYDYNRYNKYHGGRPAYYRNAYNKGYGYSKYNRYGYAGKSYGYAGKYGYASRYGRYARHH